MEEKKVPALRFRGFDNAWEQRRLGELADKVTEKNTLLAKTEVLTNSAEFGIINQREFFDHDIVNENNIGGYYIVRERDFVYNPRISVSAPVGPINCNKLGKSGVMSPLYTVFRVHDIDSVYLEYFFKTSRWHSFMRFNGDSGVRSDRFSIKTELFYKMPIPITKYCEQVKIGKYFSQLDHLISLHQRKLEMLKKVKKSMLEKMFPKNDAKVPEVRFSDFTDAWEQRRFKELFEEKREKTVLEWEDVLLSCAITGIYLNSELFSHFRGTSTIGYLKIKKNDLILSAQNLHLGNANVNLYFESGIISPAYKVFSLVNCDPLFVQAWVKREATNKFFLETTTEGASQCRKNIEWNTLDKQLVSVPTILEGHQIGRYFSQLDHLISLHQRKLEKLKNIKKSMLEKMFII